MRTFEESLERVLDPDGFYWRHPGDDTDDQERVRMIEQRLDVPAANVPVACSEMERDGWQLTDAPDRESDDLHRLYFRKATKLTSDAKRSFLTAALRVAHATNGTLMSWMDVKDLEN